MFRPGDVVVLPFRGVRETKDRPSVVVSSAEYLQQRPDLIVGLLTSQTRHPLATTDYVLQDWKAAGLDFPSVFRAFLFTSPQSSARWIGRVSDRDWAEIRERMRRAIQH